MLTISASGWTGMIHKHSPTQNESLGTVTSGAFFLALCFMMSLPTCNIPCLSPFVNLFVTHFSAAALRDIYFVIHIFLFASFHAASTYFAGWLRNIKCLVLTFTALMIFSLPAVISKKAKKSTNPRDCLENRYFRAPPGARTLDTLIKSQVLYQLS